VVLLTACVSSMLAKQVVAPPNKSGIKPIFWDSPVVARGPDAYSDTWKIHVNDPPADIAVASVEPGDYGLQYDLRLSYPDGRAPNIDFFNAYWRPAKEVVRRTEPPLGTIVIIHGYLTDKRFLVPWAVRLAQAGYRCALVDLRGHGESTGKHIGFGAFEAHDVSAVIDDLAARGWDVSHVGLLGVSYGASVALLTAGRDARISRVVAFEPFSSAEKAVPELMRAVFTKESKGISDAQFAAAHIKEARIAGFDWADADIPAALARTRAPVLFLHGAADHWLSPDHSRALAKVAPPGSELVIVPRDNHVTLPLQLQPFEQRVIGWFGALSAR
jgi:pimeloyl-ACP methyl ester carboxylesterase